jgi:hypothetical protein
MTTITEWENNLAQLPRSEILERVGAEKWSDVVLAFGGKTLSEVRAELQAMFTNEPDANDELAQAIMREFVNP